MRDVSAYYRSLIKYRKTSDVIVTDTISAIACVDVLARVHPESVQVLHDLIPVLTNDTNIAVSRHGIETFISLLYSRKIPASA